MKTIRPHAPFRLRLAAAAFAVVVSSPLTATVQADPIFQGYIYGISDANLIWQINPGAKTDNPVYATPLSGTSNALAFDRNRDQMFFMNKTGTFNSQPYTNGLFLWNKPQGTFSLLGQGAELDLATDGDIPANATFYDDAFWFFKEGTKTLVKTSLTYTGSTPNGISGFTTYTMDTGTFAPSDDVNRFGDIAINPNSGVLFGYTARGPAPDFPGGQFYSLDLNTITGSNTLANYSLISTTTGTGLQIAYNADYSILYGHNYDDGKWFEIDTNSGALTDLGFSTLVANSRGFRDLAGASIVAVPEPGTMALAVVGVVGGGFFLRRRGQRRRRA